MRTLTNELTFNGMRIRTTASQPNKDNQTFYVDSQTDRGTHYIVRTRKVLMKVFNQFGHEVPSSLIPTHLQPKTEEFEYICDCPDFTVRRWVAREDCKHIEAIKALALLAGSPYNLAVRLQSL